jgi:hypothetical protein
MTHFELRRRTPIPIATSKNIHHRGIENTQVREVGLSARLLFGSIFSFRRLSGSNKRELFDNRPQTRDLVLDEDQNVSILAGGKWQERSRGSASAGSAHFMPVYQLINELPVQDG